jgi:hypothetical protein
MNQSIKLINDKLDEFRNQVIEYQSYNYNKEKSIQDINNLLSNQTLNEYDKMIQELNEIVYQSDMNSVSDLVSIYNIVLAKLDKFIEKKNSSSDEYVLKIMNTRLGVKYLGYLLSIIIRLNVYIKLLGEYLDLYKAFELVVGKINDTKINDTKINDTKVGGGIFDTIQSAITKGVQNISDIQKIYLAYNKTDELINTEFFDKIFPKQLEFSYEIKLPSKGKIILSIIRIGDFCSIELNKTTSLCFKLEKIKDNNNQITYSDCDSSSIYLFNKPSFNFVDIGYNFSIIKSQGIQSLTSSSISELLISNLKNIINNEEKVLLFNPDKNINFMIRYYGCTSTGITSITTFTRRQFVIKKSGKDNIISINNDDLEKIKELI